MFAVGEANGPEARSPPGRRCWKQVLAVGSRSCPTATMQRRCRVFDRKEANLAILRTDARIPPAPAPWRSRTRLLLLISRPAENKNHRGVKKGRSRSSRRRERGRLLRNIRASPTPGGGDAGPDGTAGAAFDSVRRRLRRRGQDRARLADREGQELRAIYQARRLHPERDRSRRRRSPGSTGGIRGNGGDRHAVRLARGPAEDVDTIGEWLLVAQSKLSTTT